MNVTNPHRFQGSNFNLYYQAVLAEAISQGASLPSTACQEIQNTLAQAINDILGKLDYFVFTPNDVGLHFCEFNWRDPLKFQFDFRDITNFEVDPWTWNNKDGLDVGSTFDSGFNPRILSTEYSLNDACDGYYLGDAGIDPIASGDNQIYCRYNGDNRNTSFNGTSLIFRLNCTTNWSMSSATYGDIGKTSSNVLCHIQRTGVDDLEFYRNGSLANTTSSNTSDEMPESDTIGRNSGAFTNKYIARWKGKALTAGEISTLDSAIRTAQTAIAAL